MLADGEHFTRVKVCGMNDTDPYLHHPYTLSNRLGSSKLIMVRIKRVQLFSTIVTVTRLHNKCSIGLPVSVDYYNFYVGVMSFGVGVAMPDFGTFIGAFGLGQGGWATVSNFNEFVNDVPQYDDSYWGLWLCSDNSKIAPWMSGLDADDGGGGLSSQTGTLETGS